MSWDAVMALKLKVFKKSVFEYEDMGWIFLC